MLQELLVKGEELVQHGQAQLILGHFGTYTKTRPYINGLIETLVLSSS